jgi:subtilisin family serine protease
MDRLPHVVFEVPKVPERTGPVGAAPVAVGSPPKAEVRVEDLTPAEVAEARSQPNVFTAPPMRTRLIKPIAVGGADPAATQVAWGIDAVGALTSPFTGAGVKVAVLDTGIDRNHPAFAGVNIVEEDFTGEGNGDTHGHGTHCAGTILGRDVNNIRIGVAPGVTDLLVGKVLGAEGGSTEMLVKGIMWALDNGASVISMSIGMDFPGQVAFLISRGFAPEAATSFALKGYRDNVDLFESVAKFLDDFAPFGKSALIIAASGNESERSRPDPYTIDVSPPAVADGIVSVGAIGQAAGGGFDIAPFSNTGAKLVGPGVNVVSAGLGGGLVAMSGTSMATPHVAGIAALWAEQRLQTTGELDTAQLAGFLVGRTQNIANLAPIDAGAGLAQAPQL